MSNIQTIVGKLTIIKRLPSSNNGNPRGCIVGLKAKGEAKTDSSGFVVRLQGLTTKGQVI